MNHRVGFGLLMGGFALTMSSGVAQAAGIYGTFSIGGSITVSASIIDFVNFSNLANLYLVGPPPPTGAFSAVSINTQGAIEDLNLATEPVATPFSDPGWLTLPSPDGNLSITLTYIYAGADGQAECTAPVAPNQTCTPLDAAHAPGPFNLQNSASGTTSSASFEFAGYVTDGTPADDTPITGQFSVSFFSPYQTVLATLASSGSVTETYDATFISPIPEPGGAMLALGGFLVGAALLAKKKIAKG